MRWNISFDGFWRMVKLNMPENVFDYYIFEQMYQTSTFKIGVPPNPRNFGWKLVQFVIQLQFSKLNINKQTLMARWMANLKVSNQDYHFLCVSFEWTNKIYFAIHNCNDRQLIIVWMLLLFLDSRKQRVKRWIKTPRWHRHFGQAWWFRH